MQPWWRELAGRCRGRMLAPLYRFYEHRLLRQVRASPVPRHIGLILDGNRRFGRRYNLSHPDDIYMAGANKLDSPNQREIVNGVMRILSTSFAGCRFI